MSYNLQILNAKDDLTLTDRIDFRKKAIDAGVQRAIDMAIAKTPEQLDVRPFLPLLDGVATIDAWITTAIGVVATESSVINGVATVALPATKLVVWYKVALETVPVPVSKLLFRINAAAGTILREFDLEQIINSQTMEGYFSNPVIWEPSRTYAVNVMSRINTGLGARVQLGGFVIEPRGNTISI